MSAVVFILGAGASQHCGAPLMNNFLDIAYNLLITGQVEEKKEHFERVFKAIGALQAVHSKSQLDITNIESVFTTFEIANLIGKLPDFDSNEIPQVITSLKELIVKTIEKTILFPTKGRDIQIPVFYERLKNSIDLILNNTYRPLTVSIITFNYDIVLDFSFCISGLAYDYGFVDFKNQKNIVQILKLHGSLNWASQVDDGKVIAFDIKDYLNLYGLKFDHKQSHCNIPIGSRIKEKYSSNGKCSVEPVPVIVPPTWNKSEHHKILSNVWRNAAKHLEEAEYIVVIGYSLPETDAFFRLLYALGTVNKKPLKKFIVYNPEKIDGIVDKRFKSILGSGAISRYEYKELKFDNNCIDNINQLFQNKS